MKKYRFTLLLLLIFSFPSFAQLNKEVVETKFPLLKLPYTTKGMVASFYNDEGKMTSIADSKYLKSDITSYIKTYTEGSFNFEISSKYFSIGRVSFAGKLYLIYVESSTSMNDGKGVNFIYMVSLKNDFQPVEAGMIGKYSKFQDFDSSGNSIYYITDVYSTISVLNNKLNIKSIWEDKTRKFDDKVDKMVDVKSEIEVVNSQFDANGKIVDLTN